MQELQEEETLNHIRFQLVMAERRYDDIAGMHNQDDSVELQTLVMKLEAASKNAMAKQTLVEDQLQLSCKEVGEQLSWGDLVRWKGRGQQLSAKNGLVLQSCDGRENAIFNLKPPRVAVLIGLQPLQQSFNLDMLSGIRSCKSHLSSLRLLLRAELARREAQSLSQSLPRLENMISDYCTNGDAIAKALKTALKVWNCASWLLLDPWLLCMSRASGRACVGPHLLYPRRML